MNPNEALSTNEAMRAVAPPETCKMCGLPEGTTIGELVMAMIEKLVEQRLVPRDAPTIVVDDELRAIIYHVHVFCDPEQRAHLIKLGLLERLKSGEFRPWTAKQVEAEKHATDASFTKLFEAADAEQERKKKLQ